MSGYPTQGALNRIKKWDYSDVRGLVAFVKQLWTWEKYLELKGKRVLRLELHTGGWSGNESIIDALQDNVIFWSMTWMKSVRGGHYYFRIRPARPFSKKL